MIRLVVFLLGIAIAAAGVHWLADRPGTIVLEWQGLIAETSVLSALVLLAAGMGAIVAAWSLLRRLWSSPAALGRVWHRRRQKRGFDALASGIIAVGAGDRSLASRFASQARKALPNEPLTHLLRAQTAQLTGDKATARRIFEAMLASPDTEQLGLRGLFLEAQQGGESAAARQFAERAVALNPKLAWPVEALFELQCRAADWAAALDTLAIAERQRLVAKLVANRRRAVLLTAQAQAAEDPAAPKALQLALEAHRLAPDLVPAAAIAGRILAAQGNTPRAARVLLKTWRLAPHPELAAAYSHVRPGDSPRDRLNRMRQLGRFVPNDTEAPVAVAIAAIDAREWEEARRALEPIAERRLTQRVCTLMARIEAEQYGDAGRVREWLARAVAAPRDATWTADGVTAEHWAPVSPVTGSLDAFRWRVPADAAAPGALLHERIEALIALGQSEPLLEHRRGAASTAPAEREMLESSATIADGEVEPESEAVLAPVRPTLGAEPARAAVEAVAASAPEAPAAMLGAQATERRAEASGTGEESAPTAPPSTAAPQRPRKVIEAKIFVSPRAPDDPGDDRGEEHEAMPLDPLHPSQAKA
jgi:HemY protein